MPKTSLDVLRELANRLNEYPPGYTPTQEQAERRDKDKERWRRLFGTLATSVYGVNPNTGKVAAPFDTETGDIIAPGLVDQTLALPAWFQPVGKALGWDYDPPQWSKDAEKNSDQVLDEIRDKVNYGPPTDTGDYAIESAATMLGQPWAKVGAIDELKAPFKAAGSWAKGALSRFGPAGKVAGHAANAATLPVRAGLEFFGPAIEPSVKNYTIGTAFGTGLRTMLGDPEQEQIEDIQKKLSEGKLTQEEAEDKVIALLQSGDKLSEPNNEVPPVAIPKAKGGKIIKFTGLKDRLLAERNRIAEDIKARFQDMSPEEFEDLDRKMSDIYDKIYKLEDTEGENKLAKGGKVGEGTLLALRQKLKNLFSEAGVEGTGKEMVPVDPLPTETNLPSTTDVNLPDAEFTRPPEETNLPPEQALDSLSKRITEAPVSRRTVLKGLASLMNPLPIRMDPISYLTSDLDEGVKAAAKAVEIGKKLSPWRSIAVGRAALETFLAKSAPDFNERGHPWAQEIADAAEDSDPDFQWPHDQGFSEIKPAFERFMKRNGVWVEGGEDSEPILHYDPVGARRIEEETNRIGEWLDMSDKEKAEREAKGETNPWLKYGLSGDDDVDYHGGYVQNMLDAMEAYYHYHEKGDWPKVSPELRKYGRDSAKFSDMWSDMWEDYGTGAANTRQRGKIRKLVAQHLPEKLETFDELMKERGKPHIWDEPEDGGDMPLVDLTDRMSELENQLKAKMIGPQPESAFTPPPRPDLTPEPERNLSPEQQGLENKLIDLHRQWRKARSLKSLQRISRQQAVINGQLHEMEGFPVPEHGWPEEE